MRFPRLFAVFAATLLLTSVTVQAQTLGAGDQPIHDAARIGSGKEVSTILKAQPATRCSRAWRA